MKDSQHTPLQILLADDDADDRYFFEKALNEIALPTMLSTVENGELLISRLMHGDEPFPDVLFLDLNMPKKNGAECLTLIKGTKKLEKLPVIIYSTSLHTDVADLLYNAGAHYYIKKAELHDLKKILLKVLPVFREEVLNRPPRSEFIISLIEVDH
jgi:CheY-like chemotaxis protein